MSEHGGDIYNNIVELDYSVNISPYGIPESVREALVKSLLMVSAYPEEDYKSLRKAVAKMACCSKENVICGNGATELIYALLRAAAMLLRKKNIIPAAGLLVPCFLEYEKAAVSAEIDRINYVYLNEENDFLPDNKDIDLLLEQSNIIIVGNPNNPTGRGLSQAWLEELFCKAKGKGAFVFVDESFFLLSDLCYEGYNIRPDAIVSSFTKSMAVPGIRIGYAVLDNEELLNQVKIILPEWNVSIPAVYAGIAAAECVGRFGENDFYIKNERNFLSEKLEALGFKVYPSEADFILFKEIENTENAGLSENLFSYLLRCGILIRKCDNFAGLKKAYYRIAVRNHDDNLRLIEYIEKYKKQEDIKPLVKAPAKADIIHVKPSDIEKNSFLILTRELEEKGIYLSGDRADIIKRCIHTSADFDYANTLMFSEDAVNNIKKLIREGAHIITDTNMALSGINKTELAKYKSEVHCFMADQEIARIAKERGITRASASMECAAGLGKKLIFVVGNAPTALVTLCEMMDKGEYTPDFVVAVPVGFVNVVAAKEMIMERDIPYIVNKGRKGGSNVAAAIVNAVLYQMKEE